MFQRLFALCLVLAAAPRTTLAEEPRLFEDDGEHDPFAADGESEVAVPFESDPPGATVLLDGEEACRATPCTVKVETGMHLVVMTKDGSQEASQIVTFYPTTKKVRLTLVTPPAHLEIASTPSRQPFSIDGSARGTTPAKVDVLAGTHELRVGGDCFEPYVEKFSVRPKETRPIHPTLSPRLAKVRVSVVEDGGNALEGEVSIEGKPMGRAPATFDSPRCARSIEVVSRGERWTGSLSLDPSRVTEVVARFRAPPREAWGEIEIVPLDGRITQARIDGGEWLALPAPPQRVRAGQSHGIVCRIDGRTTETAWRSVGEDETVRYECPEPPAPVRAPEPEIGPITVNEAPRAPSIVYLRAGVGPAIGVFGAGLELDLGQFGITVGSGAAQVGAGASLLLGPREHPGLDGAFVEVNWARLMPGLLPLGEATSYLGGGGSLVGVTAGYHFDLGPVRARLGGGFAKVPAGTALTGELSLDVELGRL